MSNADPRCIYTMAQSLTGDGCRYCQAQEYIDRLHEQIEEDEATAKEADELMAEMAEAMLEYDTMACRDEFGDILQKYWSWKETTK